jgi:SP family xylose:H+ symportor-like MFS transporter
MGHIPLLLCRQLRANLNPQVLLIGVALADLQQLSGINIIFNYAEEIYHSAGYGDSGILFNIEITRNDQSSADSARPDPGRSGVAPLPHAVWVCRNCIVSSGACGSVIASESKGCRFCGSHCARLGCYALSLSPRDLGLDFGNLPESCSRYRGLDFGLCSLECSVCFLKTFTFPILNRVRRDVLALRWCLPSRPFLVSLSVPETKGKTPEEIEQ